MTIANARTFIARGMTDSVLRGRLNATATPQERDQVLAAEAMPFSAHDFDEAYHNQLTLCQEKEDADQLKEFKLWWDLLSQTLAPGPGATQCGGSCSGCG